MSVAKVIEISSGSPKNFQDAIDKGIKRAAKTVNNIQGAWVNEMNVVVKGDDVQEYRVNMKVTFVIE